MNLHRLPSSQQVVTPWQRVLQVFNLLMAWTPLLLLTAGLLLSWWLVRSTNPNVSLNLPQPPSQEADYDVRGFTLKVYDLQGQLKSSMTGASAAHSPITLTTLIERPQVWIYKEGQVTTAQANQGLANEDGSEVQLLGQAVIHRPASATEPEPMRMRSEFLHLFANTDVVQTDLPIVITKGSDSFKADSMHADNLNQVLGMKGRVKAVLHPKKEE